MIKNTLLVLLFIISAFNSCYGQDKNPPTKTQQFVKKIDSLHRDPPEKAYALLEEYVSENLEDLSNNPNDLELLYYTLAKYSYRSYDYKSLKKYYTLGLGLIQKNNLETPLYYYHNTIGSYYAVGGKPDSACYYYVLAADDLNLRNKPDEAAMVFFNIGTVYSENDDVTKSIVYLKKAYEHFKDKPEKKYYYSPVLGVLGYMYEKSDSLEQAEKIATLSIKYGTQFQERTGLIYGLMTKSNLFEKKKAIDSAIFYGRKAYTTTREKNYEDYETITAFHLANLLEEINPKEALIYALEAKHKMGSEGYLRHLGNINNVLGNLYSKIQNFEEANKYKSLYIKQQDSLYKLTAKKDAQEILEKYESSQKELKIKEQEAEITKQENQKKTLILIAVALSGITLFGFLFFRQRQKTQKQKIVNLENEKENIALRSLMSGEEQERSRIAKELHDGLGGLLAAAKMHASKKNNDDKVIELLDTASRESRRISHNLLPESLIKKGLDKALHDFVNSINDSDLLKTDYQSINLEENLPQSLQLSVYRIIQELINNIIKHSGATEALIQLQQEHKKLIITVEDNGKGFSHQQVNKGIGLQNIESRLSLLKGKLEIDSEDEKGTSVYIELELEK